MRRPGRIVVVFGLFVAVGGLALLVVPNVVVTRLAFSCVVCRLLRLDRTCLGVTRSVYEENECSRWYPTHVEPSHVHNWERGSCQLLTTLSGRPLAVACRSGCSPVRTLEPSTQMRFYQHFENPREAKALFEGFAGETVRFDDFGIVRGIFMAQAIREWEARGFPGTWDEWRVRFFAEHKGWDAGLRSTKGMATGENGR